MANYAKADDNRSQHESRSKYFYNKIESYITIKCVLIFIWNVSKIQKHIKNSKTFNNTKENSY